MNATNALRKRLGLTAQPQIKFAVAGTGLNQQQAALVAQMAERGISAVLKFCLNNISRAPSQSERHLTPRSLQVSFRKFVAVAWLLHSEMLIGEDGNPLSLHQLGKLPQTACSRCALSLIAKKFGEECKLQFRVQKRRSSKPNYAAAAKTGWEKRRAGEKAAR